MSGIGGYPGEDIDPFIQTTTQPFLSIPTQASTSVPLPVTTPAPTSTLPSPLTISEIVTETKLNPSLPASLTFTPTGTNTLTIADSESQNRNNNNDNTISTAAIILSMMIGFIIVGGCIALLFARRKPLRNRSSNIIQEDLYSEGPSDTNELNEKLTVYDQINSISPPLNLPPLPPQHSPPPHFQRFPPPPRHSPPPPPRPSPPLPPIPPIPQHLPRVLHRSPSLARNGSSTRSSRNYYDDIHFSEHDPIHLDPNYHYQNYSQLSSQSDYRNNTEDPQTNIDEPP